MSVTYATTSFCMAPEPSNRERSSRVMRPYHRPGPASITVPTAASNAPTMSSGSRRTSSQAPTAVLPPTPPQPTYQLVRAQYSEIEALFGGQRHSQSSPTPSDRTQSSTSTAPQPQQQLSRSSNSSSPSSREPRRSSGRASSTGHTLPPRYESQPHFDVESLPSYSKVEEYDAELNRKLFLYGFLFFPFWIIGIIAPFVKPNHNPEIDNRTKEDQELDDANIRRVEIRWAKRCGMALFALAIIITIAAVVGVTVSKHHHQ